MLPGRARIHRKMPISPPRLEQAIEAQKAHDALQAISEEFLYRADLLAESARCVLSYPKLIPEVRAKIARIEHLTTSALAELHRLQSGHQSVINAYAHDLYGLRPGMVIRPARKPRDRRVGVFRLSIDLDGILMAHGWRVASLKVNHPGKFADSVRLVDNAWSVEPEESLPDAPPGSSYPWSRHHKTWGEIVDSTRMDSNDRPTVVREHLRGIRKIQRALSDLSTFIDWYSSDHLLKDREATVDEVLAVATPFAVIGDALRALNVLADGIQDDEYWSEGLYREKELVELDLLTALYGIKAGDVLSVRYPNGREPQSWQSVVVTGASEMADRGDKGAMAVKGNRLRKDGTPGKREDYVFLTPYEVEWRLHDPLREAEARQSKYGDAKWCQQPPILDYDTPKDALRQAGERLIEFCRSLLFDMTGMFPNGIPITVVEVTERAWGDDWTYWRAVGSETSWYGRKGIKVTASCLGYAVGDSKQQAAVLLAAGLHQISKDRNARWCHEAKQRAGGLLCAISAVYDDLRSPYHSSTNEMLPESLADDALAKNGYELLGRGFSDEDLVRWVVRDGGESFRLDMLTFCLGRWMKQEKALSALFGRTRL